MTEPVETFKYGGPDSAGARERSNGKSYDLVSNGSVISTVQVMEKGVGNAMHSHRDQDGYWFILGGRARFHGLGDEILAEVGVHEGVFMPHGNRYWFKSVGDEPLQILRVSNLLPDA